MKSSTQVSLVAAVAAAGFGTATQALPPAAWTNGTITASNLFYAGGGSAEVEAVYVAVSKLLVTTSIDVYTDGTGNARHPQSLNYLIVSGKTITGNTPVGFFYKYNSGNLTDGVQPFLSNPSGKLQYPTTASLGTAIARPGFTGAVTSLNPDYAFTAALDAGDTPAWGISDEEATVFSFLWNANGAAIPANVTNGAPLFLVPFGIAVTANVYAQKKNWYSAEIAALYQGINNYAVTAWNQLFGDNGSTMTIPGAINLLDRGSGTGSKAASNLFFLNYPTGEFSIGGDLQPASVIAGNVNKYTGSILVTSGTTTNSFQDIKEASSAAIIDDLNAAQAAGIGAIAILSLEFPPVFQQTTTGTNSYFFVNIDGAGPDSGTGVSDNINSPSGGSTQYSNIVNSRYTLAYQAGLNENSSSPPSGFQASVVANLSSESISAANTGLSFPASAHGILLDPVTTGTTDPGNVSWTRGGNSVSAPAFVIGVTRARPDPL